ncbi:WAS/WASL-interacting protein family member 1 isoform X2 [Microplitis demolitor]|uniref:WAS/WASL-interacting protein family member 1 isoform X2 n=1 Tax=Microplitis demolitor TaxID=69319 RepID=UPI0004CC9C13|nr:WAS/WASL-interacting protein family member 1 isoform X2 [Microplitis demolitor]
MGKLPDRWLDYKPYGSVIKNTKIMAFKVPLNARLIRQLPENHQFTPELLLKEVPKLKYIIDLTNTTRYYNKKEFTDAGVEYRKIPVEGKRIPKRREILRFYRAMEAFVESAKDDEVIGVHCTHGLNRTGFLVCRFLAQQSGWNVIDAIEAFEDARGHKIERENYIEDLKTSKLDERINTSEDLLDIINNIDTTHTEKPDKFRHRDRPSSKNWRLPVHPSDPFQDRYHKSREDSRRPNYAYSWRNPSLSSRPPYFDRRDRHDRYDSSKRETGPTEPHYLGPMHHLPPPGVPRSMPHSPERLPDPLDSYRGPSSHPDGPKYPPAALYPSKSVYMPPRSAQSFQEPLSPGVKSHHSHSESHFGSSSHPDGPKYLSASPYPSKSVHVPPMPARSFQEPLPPGVTSHRSHSESHFGPSSHPDLPNHYPERLHPSKSLQLPSAPSKNWPIPTPVLKSYHNRMASNPGPSSHHNIHSKTFQAPSGAFEITPASKATGARSHEAPKYPDHPVSSKLRSSDDLVSAYLGPETRLGPPGRPILGQKLSIPDQYPNPPTLPSRWRNPPQSQSPDRNDGWVTVERKRRPQQPKRQRSWLDN